MMQSSGGGNNEGLGRAPEPSCPPVSTTLGRATFPVMLHSMLSEIDSTGVHSNIVSWRPHGRLFVIHDRKRFVQQVLPRWFFSMSRFESFQRQLNIYGFKRMSTGPDKGGLYHEMFLRGHSQLAACIPRQKVKGKGPRKPATPEREPNFYALPDIVCHPQPFMQDPSLELPMASAVAQSQGPTIVASLPENMPYMVPVFQDVPPGLTLQGLLARGGIAFDGTVVGQLPCNQSSTVPLLAPAPLQQQQQQHLLAPAQQQERQEGGRSGQPQTQALPVLMPRSEESGFEEEHEAEQYDFEEVFRQNCNLEEPSALQGNASGGLQEDDATGTTEDEDPLEWLISHLVEEVGNESVSAAVAPEGPTRNNQAGYDLEPRPFPGH